MGATLGGLLCGWIGQQVNWHLGFGIAGIFMIIGLITFYKKQHILGPIGLPPKETEAGSKTFWELKKNTSSTRVV